ncbi:MAG: hypothetical protein IIC80_03485 [Chloroflexi bacterium]|nr:hypothetical protein [Chloroflexota bacterium]
MARQFVRSEFGVDVGKVTIFAFADLDNLVNAYVDWHNITSGGRDAILEGWQRGRTAEAGYQNIFVFTSSQGWEQASDMTRLKIMTHEYFHVLQWQLLGSGFFGKTTNFSLDQVRPSGPNWLMEGAAELVGHSAVADSGFQSLTEIKNQHVQEARFVTAALESMETNTGFQTAGGAVYDLGFVATDFLLTVTLACSTSPAEPSLAAYWQAIGDDAPWQEAFESVFGLQIDEFYQRFDEMQLIFYPRSLDLPFGIRFDTQVPPGALGEGTPPDSIPYLFQVTGFDLASLSSDELTAAFIRPPGQRGWGRTRRGADLLVLYMSPSAPSGTYDVALELPDGRRVETTFQHVPATDPAAYNPEPTITSLDSPLANTGGPDFTLNVNGQDFINDSTVHWNGAPRPTEFLGSTQLRATVSASDVATPGMAGVTVVNPLPGGGRSNVEIFTICR